MLINLRADRADTLNCPKTLEKRGLRCLPRIRLRRNLVSRLIFGHDSEASLRLLAKAIAAQNELVEDDSRRVAATVAPLLERYGAEAKDLVGHQATSVRRPATEA
jgi:hypothetical protein